MNNKFFKYIFLIVDASENFNLNVLADGSFGVFVDQVEWLKSSDIFFRANNYLYESQAKTLFLNATTISNGQDILGVWKSFSFEFILFNDTETKMNCTMIKYDDIDLIRFVQVVILYLIRKSICFFFNFFKNLILSIFQMVLSDLLR